MESVGAVTRRVTVIVRAWDEHGAAERAAEIVSAASLDVIDGTSAVLREIRLLDEDPDAAD